MIDWSGGADGSRRRNHRPTGHGSVHTPAATVASETAGTMPERARVLAAGKAEPVDGSERLDVLRARILLRLPADRREALGHVEALVVLVAPGVRLEVDAVGLAADLAVLVEVQIQ